MPCNTLPLRLLGLGLAGGPLSHHYQDNVTKATEKALFGPSILQGAYRAYSTYRILNELNNKYAENRNWIPPRIEVPDFDMVLELKLDDGKIIQPYQKGKSFNPCKITRWYDPSCVPGIMSKIRHNKDIVCVIHGNDQYIAMYPVPVEIGEDHELREIVEDHFTTRGLDFITEDWYTF
jgi:hypothetical protein